MLTKLNHYLKDIYIAFIQNCIYYVQEEQTIYRPDVPQETAFSGLAD